MSQAPSPAGLVVVDKAGGMTSHDVVSRVRRLAGTRKVGHAGTLDPMATGVLVLGVNRATRLLGHLMLTEKGYDATIRLGRTTSTDDAEGETTSTTPAGQVTESEIRSALAQFVGDIEQVPTAVSAIKVDGKRAYQRVRDGETVALKARPVTVHEIVVHAVSFAGQPGGDEPRVDEPGVDEPGADESGVATSSDQAAPGQVFVDVDVSVRCSSGTYIRAIARDLGAALGVGGHLTALRRTAVGGFDLSVARTLDQLGDEFTMVPIADAARATFPAYELNEEQAGDVRVGRKLRIGLTAITAVFAPDGEFLALYEPVADNPELARALAVFTG